MPRTTKTITFSLPLEMAERLDEVMQQQDRSRSEFLREAVLRYIMVVSQLETSGRSVAVPAARLTMVSQ